MSLGRGRRLGRAYAGPSRGRLTAKVLADQRLARELNISGVPGTLMVRGEQGLIISGAQPYEALKEATEELLDG